MIAIEHVTKAFASVRAVDDLSLEIPDGELFCFLGPNGAGKTTTIKMMCGLLRPTAGTIRIDGFDTRADMPEIRRRIGYIPDSPFLYDRLTSSEFFAFIGDLYRMPPDRVRAERAEAFALFGLEAHADALIRDLSHGLRQRLTYAATFLHRPRILFVDEPFIGLDPHSIRLIKGLLKQKTREGATVFMTTHILALIEDLADRIGILHHGRLAALGTLDDLRRQTNTDGRLEDIFLGLTEAGA
jgi:ABC-2 type transport system ATP-binding protein